MKNIVLVTLLAAGQAPDASSAPDRSAALEALAQFEARDHDWKARMEAMVGLARRGESAVPVLIEAARKGSPEVRVLAIQALEVLGDPHARATLLEALSDETPTVRAAAVRALGALGPIDPAAEPFRHLLEKDPERTVRHAAAWALECDDGSSAAAAMREALRSYELSRMDSARLHEPAPDFSLLEPSGKVHRPADLRGKKAVVLEFYNEPL